MHSKSDQDLNLMLFRMDNNPTTISPDSTASANKLISRNQILMPTKTSMIYPSPPLPSPSSPTSLIKKRVPLIRRRSNSVSDSPGCSGPFAELAGGTTAECAAVCCCCPCGLAHLLYLTIYKVPAGLCRRALRRKRSKKLLEKGLLHQRTKRCYCDLDDIEIHMDLKPEEEISSEEDGGEEDEAMMKLEEEMWETFYNAGFWRSSSQRETKPKIIIIESPKAAGKVVKQL